MANTTTSKKPPMMGKMGHGRNSFEKSKNFKKSFKELILYLKPYSWGIVFALIFAILGTTFAIIGPKILALITEEIIKGIYPGASINFIKITNVGIILVALYAFSFLLNFLQQYIMNTIIAKISKNMRSEISLKINNLPLHYYDDKSFGDLLSRMTNDVDTLGQSLNQSLSSFITSLTMFIGTIIMMFTISLELTLIALISIPLTFIVVAIIVKFSQKYFMAQQELLGSLNSEVEEIYSNHNIVKVYSAEERELESFNKINSKLAKNTQQAQFMSNLTMPLTHFISNLAYVLVCVIGGAMALKNPIFIASIIAFITYIRQLNQPVSQLSSIASTLQTTVATSERIFEFLSEKEMEDDSNKITKIANLKGDVEFKNINFGYTAEKQIIFDFSCMAKAGEKIAIVGPTGAGKTTLVNLLMKFYEPQSGQILIDGVDISTLSRDYIHSLFGMVLQETWLFEGSILDNLTLGNKSASMELIEECSKSANVHHFIKSLPNGYNHIIAEDANISQGQKQLLTIARAMIENSPMLILDEATSSVDTRSEVLIQKAMDNLMKGRTSFIIAHRLSTIKNADKILVMKDGNVIEQGTHNELIAQNGFYTDLYNSQFSKKERI
ncbi:MAG: ABC transporter ATP-binding protein [Clostridia bacterium]